MKKSNILLIILFNILITIGLLVVYDHFFIEKDVVVNEVKSTTIETNGSLNSSIDLVYDCVATVYVYKNNALISTGTAFTYKKDDTTTKMLTNHHVIDGGDKIVVQFEDSNFIDATILGSDSYMDIAVLEINDTSRNIASLGDDSKGGLGDIVFTVGSPLGFSGSITGGYISKLNRFLTLSNDAVLRLIQTDAAINPGNSGGPLVNTSGEVIGVNSLKFSKEEVEGMGFAIPITDVLNIVDLLESGNVVSRPLLGVTMKEVTDKDALNEFGITIEKLSGVLIIDVTKDSSADLAGIKKGDIITEIDSSKVNNIAEFKYTLYTYSQGDKALFKVIRNDEEIDIEVLFKDAL